MIRYVPKSDCPICFGVGLIGTRFPTYYSPDDTDIEPCECVEEKLERGETDGTKRRNV